MKVETLRLTLILIIIPLLLVGSVGLYAKTYHVNVVETPETDRYKANVSIQNVLNKVNDLLEWVEGLGCQYYLTDSNSTIASPGVYCVLENLTRLVWIHGSDVVLIGNGYYVWVDTYSLDTHNLGNITIYNVSIDWYKLPSYSGPPGYLFDGDIVGLYILRSNITGFKYIAHTITDLVVADSRIQTQYVAENIDRGIIVNSSLDVPYIIVTGDLRNTVIYNSLLHASSGHVAGNSGATIANVTIIKSTLRGNSKVFHGTIRNVYIERSSLSSIGYNSASDGVFVGNIENVTIVRSGIVTRCTIFLGNISNVTVVGSSMNPWSYVVRAENVENFRVIGSNLQGSKTHRANSAFGLYYCCNWYSSTTCNDSDNDGICDSPINVSQFWSSGITKTILDESARTSFDISMDACRCPVDVVLDVKQVDMNEPKMVIIARRSDGLTRSIVVDASNSGVIANEYGYILSVKDRAVVFSPVEILDYSVDGDKIVVRLAKKDTISIATPKNVVRRIVVDLGNGTTVTLCSSVDECEMLRDGDGVIVVDPVKVEIYLLANVATRASFGGTTTPLYPAMITAIIAMICFAIITAEIRIKNIRK